MGRSGKINERSEYDFPHPVRISTFIYQCAACLNKAILARRSVAKKFADKVKVKSVNHFEKMKFVSGWEDLFERFRHSSLAVSYLGVRSVCRRVGPT